MFRPKSIILLFVALLALVSCAGGKGDSTLENNEITEASLLQIQHEKDYTLVTVTDPWSKQKGRVLHKYVLVDRNKPQPASLPEGTVVRVPLDSAIVYSSVHSGVLDELGAGDAVKGVADAQYFNDDRIAKGLKDGTITDCGSSMSPLVEKVISMTPDAILLSPYQDATYGQITKLDIPIIECADYMENTPLGRAEWIKFYGELVGKRTQADSIYNEVVKNYNATRDEIAKKVKKRPMVLTESVISGVWNVPGGKSYMALLIQDAGGDYPWADDNHTGSLTLDFNQVLAKAQQADVWLIKSMGIQSLDDLRAQHKLNSEFEAFKRRNVYICDTGKTHFFDRFPFHPDVLLREYAMIFHPTVFNDTKLVFFKRVE